MLPWTGKTTQQHRNQIAQRIKLHQLMIRLPSLLLKVQERMVSLLVPVKQEEQQQAALPGGAAVHALRLSFTIIQTRLLCRNCGGSCRKPSS